MSECIFCKIINKEIDAHIIFEDNDICCFLDIEPINPGHVLIAPKIHNLDVDEIDDEVAIKIMLYSKKLVKVLKNLYTPDGYSIMHNGGIFNDIGHYHMHVFPRYKQDGFNWTFSDTITNDDLSIVKRQLEIEFNVIENPNL